MSAEALELQVELSFGGFELGVDERIALDGVTALFGPNGSGKSTLLRAIAGFETPRNGRVALGSRVWFDTDAGINVAPHLRPVGYMFQDGRLFDHLTAGGNLDFAEKRSLGGNGEAITAALELAPLLDKRIGALSGGERQRVALGRTLLTQPKLLLLDEPLSALDAERKAEILPYLEQLPIRFGIPTIYVSHSIDEVAQLADRALVLADGRVQAHGPTAEILERLDLQPLTGRFEAGVVLDARVTGHDERLLLTRVEVSGHQLVMPAIERAAAGDHVRLRIRARDVALATERPRGVSIRNVLPARILEVTPQPDSAFAEVLLDVDGAHIRSRLTRAAVEDLDLREGLEVFALIKSVSFDRRIA